MARTSRSTELKLPPQLIGVHLDALRTNAVSFKLERLPSLVMASCSSQNRAMEIDFETGAGQAMIDYLVVESNVRNGNGNFLLEYEGKQFRCKVTTDGKRNPSWLEVRWKTAETTLGAEQEKD